jgi:hypothetical protein
MSTKSKDQPQTENPTVTLPEPKRGFMYVQVPEDLHRSVFDLPALYSLCRLQSGGVLEDFDDKLAKVVAKCMLTGKKGVISLTIGIKPEGSKRTEVLAKVDAKPPQDEIASTYLFATERGQLMAQDPDQREFDLKIVPLHQRDRVNVRDVLETSEKD